MKVSRGLSWNLFSRMPCSSVKVTEHKVFSVCCVLAETPLLCSRCFFLLKLSPWSFLWKLIGALLFPYTKHGACHLVPSAYRKPVQIYLSSCERGLSTQLGESFLYEAFQTVSTVTNRTEMWRRQFSLSSCSDRALCLLSLSHWLMPLYQQPATQGILESLSTHHCPLFCGSILFNSCHNCTYTSQIWSFFTTLSRYPLLTCFILNPLIIGLCGSSYSVTLENEWVLEPERSVSKL